MGFGYNTGSLKDSEVGIDYNVVDDNIKNIYNYLVEMEEYLLAWDAKFEEYATNVVEGELQKSLLNFRETIKASVIDDFYTTVNEQAIKFQQFSNIVKNADGGL